MKREQFDECTKEADARMKKSNGHTYMTILKTRCIFCGASPKRSTRCPAWLNTYMDRLADVLQEQGVIE